MYWWRWWCLSMPFNWLHAHPHLHFSDHNTDPSDPYCLSNNWAAHSNLTCERQ
jgi:hypothetical protein